MGSWLRRLTPLLALALAVPILSPGPTSAQTPPNPAGPPPNFVPGEILVKFQPGTAGQAVADAHSRNGGQVRDVIPGIDVQVVRVPAGQELSRVAAYRSNPNVRFAEVNGFYHAIDHGTPNDARVRDQWQYNNPYYSSRSRGDIDAFEAWHVTTGSPSVPIAILDTGIDQSHEDLRSKITKNRNFTSSRTVDDRYVHGTHVAGSAAAATNNSVGVAGTCPNCTLYNVKVLGDDGSGAWDWIAYGITWAADNGAKVISMSLGGYYDSQAVIDAVDYAWGKGVVLTAAAGNDGQNWAFRPAFYENVIAVAATDGNDARASFSNHGGNWVDVAAPGVNILSTAPDHANRLWTRGVSYGTLNGTSMATPHVAGVAGLVWSTGLCSTNLSPASCVRGRIQERADKIAGTGGTFWDLWTHGRINADRSVAP